MKTVVKHLFMDKNVPGKKYFPGDVVEFDNERAAFLLENGLVEKHNPLKDENTIKVKKTEKLPEED